MSVTAAVTCRGRGGVLGCLGRWRWWVGWVVMLGGLMGLEAASWRGLEAGFREPPAWARPWAYWFWMDGQVSREGITADLEAMERAGLGGVILMEVDVGIPRGAVEFMGEAWRGMFGHVVREAKRLGLEVTLNAGPGWTGSGGPWVKPEQSMQHLVGSSVVVTGPGKYSEVLPRPQRRPAFFGDGGLPAELERAKNEFYRDVAVLAFPAPEPGGKVEGLEEKALYVRAPYSSQPGTVPFVAMPAEYPELPAGTVVARDGVLDVTRHLGAGGRFEWEVPAGKWVIVRLGRTSTGANTRPAPLPGLGLESDKFDAGALEAHFEAFVGTLLKEVGRPSRRRPFPAGWTMLHIDSWEMGSQNWTAGFRGEFERRRGYDPMPYLPVMAGWVVGESGDGRRGTVEISERFLWDLRLTSQELVVENHARRLKTLGRRQGLGLSIEPYDMNPCADLTLGAVADVPMCEFWLMGFNTVHTVTEAVSVAHTNGRRVVAAEAFTSTDAERWLAYPGMMKTLGDWAFCAGVNRIVFHRYQHQPDLNRWPGMTMGPYGVHWERTQTWWEMVPAYHRYLARCQYLLRQGLSVADVCFLSMEGAPHVFRPPTSAVRGDPPDPREYAFDGCSPETLRAGGVVREGRLEFPDGMSYRVLVLPEAETMTPGLLRKVRELVWNGLTVIGPRPVRSPGLSGYPGCDEEVRRLGAEVWGGCDGERVTEHRWGKGRVVWERTAEGDRVRPGGEREQYGNFGVVRRVLEGMGVGPDFVGDERLRYHHRRAEGRDIYFVASRATNGLMARCGFRVVGKEPWVWDPMTGEVRAALLYEEREGMTWVPLGLEAEGSVFVVFRARGGGRERRLHWAAARRDGRDILPPKGEAWAGEGASGVLGWLEARGGVGWVTDRGGDYAFTGSDGSGWGVRVEEVPVAREVTGPWEVRFQPGRGAPERREFATLTDWTASEEEGVRYFSGRAEYRATFGGPAERSGVRWWLDLGRVEVMARVRLNGRDLGVLWKAPYRVEVTSELREGVNELEVEVANRWPNRLIGDRRVPETARVTSTTWNPFRAETGLLPSGLLGPVRLEGRVEARVEARGRASRGVGMGRD